MRPLRVLCFACVLVFGCAALYAEDDPLLSGYVTRAGTPQDFDVNGMLIVCGTKTVTRHASSSVVLSECPTVTYGERLTIFGTHIKRKHAIAATEIDVAGTHTGQSLSGVAVVDSVLSANTFRADGFAIRTGPATKVERRAPLAPAATPGVGEWVRYAGKLGPDGVIVAAQLVFEAPAVTPRERKIRDKGEFDPAAVTVDDAQSPLSKFVLGTNYKRLPASGDGEQQSRVERIGNRLVPPYQRKLAAADPNRLNFRFQLVESDLKDCIVLSNGITLVPDRVAARLTVDAELATVMANCIAEALEKQSYRYLAANTVMSAASIASDALYFVPLLGLATGVGTGVASHKDHKHFNEQAARMSVVLMHDAGFDPAAAPMAWWRLSTGKEDFLDHSPPYVSQYLFQTLTTLWGPASPLAAATSQEKAQR